MIPENPRITNSQKAIRTNDIENVGKTARHHTMFEMLGNFSVGDYFRDEAIEWGYELLTSPEWFDFPKDKLYMTYYPDDKDSYNRWIACGVEPSHLIPIEDNFWEIGAGPSGPDTEIFFDRGEDFDPDNIGIRLLEEDIENDRYIEIWNIVLSQFNADPAVPRSEYKELPNKNIDTGAGLERLVAVMQGAKTNFETDLFMPIIREIEKMSGKTYDPDGDTMSFKVIADHIRSLAFAIGDGALPGNEGRGYVLRRLLRRAVMHGRRLGISDAFLYKLVPTVGQIMESYYPEVLEKKQTPFYAEMGGQVADHGTISDAAGTVVARVVDVQRAPNGQALHTVEVEGELVVGANYKLEIDHTRRHRVMKNHTATHLLHAALHNIVGDHAVQAGSLNEQEFLRFDFTHFEAVTPEELRAIEEQVNEEIWKATPVTTIETDIDTAKSMGAMALFGEKYGKNVRVVSIGDYSVELCGGTHVANTAEIGMFKIVKEEGIGSGTRRILAVTSREAYLAYREEEDALKAIAATLKAPQLKEVPNKVASLQEQLHALQKENAALKEKAAAAAAGDVFKDVKEANGVRYIASKVEVSDAGALRTFADQWKQADYSDVLVLAAHIGEKVNVLVASKSKDVHAGNVIKVLAPIVSGRGGGKPDMAMAGGSDANGIQDLLSAVAEQL